MSTTAPERKDFAANKRLREIMGEYFAQLGRGPAEGKKTAWCTSVGPAELLWAMGFNVFFPENHAAMIGAARMAAEVIPLANAKGFSPDVCSYLTSDIGAYVKGASPLQKMGLSGPPKPDVLVFNTNQCRDVKDWFQFYAREWNVPCLGIHTPRAIGEVDRALVQFVAHETAALVEPLEAVAGAKLDVDRLREVIGISRRTTERWKAVLDMGARAPAPLTFFDGTIQMAPAVVMRGLPEAADYYDLLLAELDQRVRDGVAAVEGERFRLYWEGMPIWGKLSALSGQMLSLRAAVVASTYCNSWVFEALDPNDPFTSMAEAYSSIFICRSDDRKERYIEEMIARYRVDGVIYHDAKTCPNNSNCRYGLAQRMMDRTGKPFLVINGDLNDMRLYSEEQTRTNLEAFVEQLDQS